MPVAFPCLSVSLVLFLAVATPTQPASPSSASPAPHAAQPANQSRSEVAEVERLERELTAAIARGDLATYDRIVADDYVAFMVDGRQATKREIMASYRSGARRYVSLEIFDVTGRVFGDTAVVSARTRGSRVEDGRQVPNQVRFIRVFTRRGGTWRAVAQMAADEKK